MAKAGGVSGRGRGVWSCAVQFTTRRLHKAGCNIVCLGGAKGAGPGGPCGHVCGAARGANGGALWRVCRSWGVSGRGRGSGAGGLRWSAVLHMHPLSLSSHLPVQPHPLMALTSVTAVQASLRARPRKRRARGPFATNHSQGIRWGERALDQVYTCVSVQARVPPGRCLCSDASPGLPARERARASFPRAPTARPHQPM